LCVYIFANFVISFVSRNLYFFRAFSKLIIEIIDS
jgi:hypothetical protein